MYAPGVVRQLLLRFVFTRVAEIKGQDIFGSIVIRAEARVKWRARGPRVGRQLLFARRLHERGHDLQRNS